MVLEVPTGSRVLRNRRKETNTFAREAGGKGFSGELVPLSIPLRWWRKGYPSYSRR